MHLPNSPRSKTAVKNRPCQRLRGAGLVVLEERGLLGGIGRPAEGEEGWLRQFREGSCLTATACSLGC